MAATLDMTQGKPISLILKFAFPLIIANVFQQVYGVVDIIIVGRWVGAAAFSAVGATIALSNIFMALCWGSTIGLSVVIAQYFGAKDEKGAAAAIMNGFYVCFVIAAFISVAGLIFTRPLLKLLGTPEILMPDAVTYIQVTIGGLLAVTAYHAVFASLRAFGDSKTPLYFMIGANVLNVGLDLLFVIPLKMGVFGAAIATVLSQLIAALCCICYAFKTFAHFQNALHYAKPNKRLIGQVLKIGIPSGFQYSLVFLSASVLQWIINGFGASVIGAFAATSRIEMLVEQPFSGLGAAIVTFTGQNIGANQFERVKEGVRAAAKLASIYALGMLVVFWTAGNIVMGMFVNDSAIVSSATMGIRITSVFFFAMGMSRIFRNLLNGAGDSFYSLVNGIVEIGGRVGLAILLTHIAFIGVWGIWVATGLTWLIAMCFALWRYKSGTWTTKSLIKPTGN